MTHDRGSTHRALRLCGLAVAVSLALPALAQERSLSEASALDVLTVTTQGRAERIDAVPVAVSVLDLQTLQVIGAGGEDVRQLSGRTPGLIVESPHGRAYSQFHLRGLGNADADPHASQPVALIRDGVVQSNAMLNGFPLFDLGRVDVARGPQGALQGHNALAGVVNIESARPEDAFGGYARIGVGERDLTHLEGAITGPLSAHVSARLSLLRQTRDDWVENACRPGDCFPFVEAVGKDQEGYEDTAARLQILFKPSDTFDMLANVHARRLEGNARLFRGSHLRSGSLFESGTNDLADDFRRDVVSMNASTDQSLDQFGGHVRMRWELGTVELHSITGYESVDYASRSDADGTSEVIFLPPRGNGPGFIGYSYATGDEVPNHRQWSQEFRIQSREWGRFDWQAGLFWFNERLTADNLLYDQVSPFGEIGRVRVQQDRSEWAVFASGDVDVTERFRLRGGLRYTDARKDFVARRYDGLFGDAIAPIRVDVDDTQLDWDLGGVFEASEQVHLHARVATGYRAPGAQARMMFSSRFLTSADHVSSAKGETLLSYEAGVKAAFLDDRLRLGFALYRYTGEDLQVTAARNGSQPWRPYVLGLTNIDRVVGRGAEFELQARVTDGLSIGFGASYNDTGIQDKDLGTFTCDYRCTVRDPARSVDSDVVLVDGNPLPYAPRHVYNLSARYEVPLGQARFFVHTDWTYRSKINFFLYDAIEGTGKPLLEGGLRLGVNWKDGRYEAALFGRNITDEQVVVNAMDHYEVTGALNEPRTWGAELLMRF
jgi:iron complex outermembrane receptor protein